MYRLLFLFLFLLSAGALRASPVTDTLYASRLPYTLNKSIPYHIGDDPGWASPYFDDQGWQLRNPLQKILRKEDSLFPALSWWRLALVVDSDLAGKAISIDFSARGAADIYLDGSLLHRFAAPLAAEDSNATAGHDPFIFAAPSAGTHLLAIRYTQHRSRARRGGFDLYLGEANAAVKEDREEMSYGVATLMTLFGLFLAFGVLHLIIFFYHRSVLSNMWFSAFSFLLAGVFGMLAMKVGRADGLSDAELGKTTLVLVSLTCYALSGLVNNLFFGRRSWWLRILLLAGLMLSLVLPKWGNMLIVGGIMAAALEAIVILVLAVYRRRPGARIIASGMLLFIVLILAVLIISATLGAGHMVLSSDAVAITALILIVIAIASIPLSMSAYMAWNISTMSRNLKTQLGELERLSAETRRHEAERQRMLESRQEELEHEVAVRTEELRGQKQKSDDLLLNILPAEVAEELKEYGAAAARLYDNVSVLFTDFADFTQRSELVSPQALIAELDVCFRAFDDIIGRHGLEKIKTVGDAYIAVCGLPVHHEQHAYAAVRAAMDIKAFMQQRQQERGDSFLIRLGIHSGPVIAGIVGVKKFAYDIWGDTVNTAARMEQHSDPGQLNISEATYGLVKDTFRCTYRGALEAKHKGKMGMYFVEGEV